MSKHPTKEQFLPYKSHTMLHVYLVSPTWQTDRQTTRQTGLQTARPTVTFNYNSSKWILLFWQQSQCQQRGWSWWSLQKRKTLNKNEQKMLIFKYSNIDIRHQVIHYAIDYAIIHTFEQKKGTYVNVLWWKHLFWLTTMWSWADDMLHFWRTLSAHVRVCW